MRTGPPARALDLHEYSLITTSLLAGGGRASGKSTRGQVRPRPLELCSSMSYGALPEGHSSPCALRGLPNPLGVGRGADWRRDRMGGSRGRPAGSIWQLSSQGSRLGFSNPERALQSVWPVSARTPQRARQPQRQSDPSGQTWWRGKACGVGDMQQGAPQASRARSEDMEWRDRAGSGAGADRGETRQARHSGDMTLNIHTRHAERQQRSAKEQDWSCGHWPAVSPVPHLELGSEGQESLLEIWKGSDSATRVVSAFLVPSLFFETTYFEKHCLVARAQKIAKESPVRGRSTSGYFSEEAMSKVNKVAALRRQRKAETQAQEEQVRARNLLGWQERETALKQAVKERQLEKERAECKKRVQIEEAGASMDKLDSSLGMMNLKEHEVTTRELEATMEVLRKAGVSNALNKRDGEEVLGVHLDAVAVCVRTEEAATGEKGVLQAVSMYGMGSGGKLFLVVAEEMAVNELSKEAVMNFMKSNSMVHVTPADIEGITTTLRPGAKPVAVPTIFEVSISLSQRLEADLVTLVQQRRTTIAGIACTLAFETSHSMSLTFGMEDRKKLGAVWKIMKTFNMTEDQLNLLVAAAVRKALALRGDSVEVGASLVGVALQRQIGPKESKIRMSVEDIVDPRGPNFRVMFSRETAPKALQDLIVQISFGLAEGADNGLIWLEGAALQLSNIGREPGLDAAISRVKERAKTIMQGAEQALSLVEDIARAELAKVAGEEGAGAWSKGNQAKVLAAIASLSGFDVTADFVKAELMQVLVKPCEHAELIQNLLVAAQELRKEMDSRRQMLSDIIIIKLGSFPKLDEIHMAKGSLKSDIRLMNDRAIESLEEWLRGLKINKTSPLSLLGAEPVVTKGRPTWDVAAGVVVAYQAPHQFSDGPPVFQKAEGAGAEEAAWKNNQVRQAAKEVMMATNITIQVIVGRKKQGASEPIRTKDHEVRICMVGEQGGALFAEKDKEEEKALLLQYAKEFKGVWVPLKWTVDGGAEQDMVISDSADLPVTKLSDLPKHTHLPFYIGNIASWLGRETVEACDEVLGLLGELERNEEMLPVKYDAEWLIYLNPHMAREIHAGEEEASEEMSDDEQSWKKFLELGQDTSDTLRALAQETLAACIKRAAGEGIWIDWYPSGGRYDSAWPTVKIQSEVVQKGTKGARWIGDACGCAITQMAWEYGDKALLRSCTETALKDYESLQVFKGSKEVGLILYGNTIRAKQLRTEAVAAGGALPAAQLDEAVTSTFGEACRREAAGGVIALVNQGGVSLAKVRAEWSEEWRRAQEAEKKLLTILEVAEKGWEEQMTGIFAAAMLQEMENQGIAVSYKTDEAYIIILTEQVTRGDGTSEAAAFEDQFGLTAKQVVEHVKKKLRYATAPDMIGRKRGLRIQAIVKELSQERLSNEIDEILNEGPCVVSNASIRGTGNDLSLVAEQGGEGTSDADLKRIIKHPGAKNAHFLRDVTEGILNSDVRCEAVGGSKNVLVFPADPKKLWGFTEWPQGDPRFQAWIPLGDGALKELAGMPSPAQKNQQESGSKDAGAKKKRSKDEVAADQAGASGSGDVEVQDRDESDARGISRTKVGGQ